MSTTTPVRPRPGDFQDNIGERDLKYLTIYIKTALRLPTSPLDISKRFSLDTSMKEKLRDQIERSANLNKMLQRDCLEFQTTTYKSLISLIDRVVSYARNAQAAFPMLRNEVEQLITAKKAGSDFAVSLEAVVEMANSYLALTEDLLKVADEVTIGFANFWIKLTTGQGLVGTEITHLTEQAKIIGQDVSGHLTAAVNALKQIAGTLQRRARHQPSSQKQPFVWVGLLGLVPPQAVQEQPGKHHFDRITQLSADQGKQITLERASLTCTMMMSHLQSIVGLLKPARGAVAIIQTLFSQMMSDLMSIKLTAEDLLAIPSESYLLLSNTTWHRLEMHALAISKNAFDAEDIEM